MELNINLNGYSIYPEIITDDDSGEWLARLIKRNGKLAHEFKGIVKKPKSGIITDIVAFRKRASIAAYAEFNTVIDDYKIGVKN